MTVSEFIKEFEDKGSPELFFHNMLFEDFLAIGKSNCRVVYAGQENCWLVKSIMCDDGEIKIYSERIIPLKQTKETPDGK